MVMDNLNIVNGSLDKSTKKLDALRYMFIEKAELMATDNGFIANGVETKNLYQDGNANILIGYYKEGTTFVTHCHNDSIEYLIITKGTILIKMGGGIRIMHKGECAAIGIGVEHSVTATEDSELLAICVPPETAYSIGAMTCLK